MGRLEASSMEGKRIYNAMRAAGGLAEGSLAARRINVHDDKFDPTAYLAQVIIVISLTLPPASLMCLV